ncbi:MAG: AEC family transporter, partial [Ruminococcus sp.]|nr:AEC family transporter [Ruminococcus sp.]
MNIFSSVIFQIAVMFSFILVGFILCRGNFIPKESGTVFSRLENKIFMPAVVINTFMANCTIENIKEKWIFIVYSTAILVFCIIVAFIISKFLGKTEYLRKIYRYSISVSNFGFVGTAMVSGIYGTGS